jgi:hypothetical protein
MVPVRSPCYFENYYSETNVMHFLFSLLRIKGLCMFRALFAHFQEALYKQHLVYCVRVVLVGCYHDRSGSSQLCYIVLSIMELLFPVKAICITCRRLLLYGEANILLTCNRFNSWLWCHIFKRLWRLDHQVLCTWSGIPSYPWQPSHCVTN